MALRRSTGANTTNQSRITGRIPSRRPTLRVAALLLSTGVLYAAVTVAAARGPDPQGAYGLPPPPDSLFITATDSQMEAAPASHLIAADPAVPPVVQAVSAEVGTAPAGITQPQAASIPGSEALSQTTPTSSVVESPKTIASSWSMSPIPEGEGGIVTSSTSIDPVSQTSSTAASPQ